MFEVRRPFVLPASAFRLVNMLISCAQKRGLLEGAQGRHAWARHGVRHRQLAQGFASSLHVSVLSFSISGDGHVMSAGLARGLAAVEALALDLFVFCRRVVR